LALTRSSSELRANIAIQDFQETLITSDSCDSSLMSIDALIGIYVQCEVFSIAAAAALHGPGYQLELWRRAVAITDIVSEEQAVALNDIARRQHQPL
jgi:hypothetical protein